MQREIIINLSPTQLKNLRDRYSSDVLWVHQIIEESYNTVLRIDDITVREILTTDIHPDVISSQHIANMLSECTGHQLYIIRDLDEVEIEFYREFDGSHPTWANFNAFQQAVNCGVFATYPNMTEWVMMKLRPSTLPLIDLNKLKQCASTQYVVYHTTWEQLMMVKFSNNQLWNLLLPILHAGIWIKKIHP